MAPRIILDFPDSSGRPARRLFNSPQRIITAHTPAEVLPALTQVSEHASFGATTIGFISYEAAPAFDAAMQVKPAANVPLLWFAVFEHENTAGTAAAELQSAFDWCADTSHATHAAAVARIHEEIAAGTTYQVNYTVRMRSPFSADPLGVYESLRGAHGVGYHAFIETAEWCVLSLSPELFFETDGVTLRTRPMKGTRPRGRFGEEDAALTDELRDSAKERAENLMIVDLMRNDVGRVAEAGSVQVTSLYDVERYPTVLQMTSTVEADLRPDTSLTDIMCALFPPGSVTGAPKISTMRLIAELESSPRGVYCGALGVVERNRAQFNVPIRTIWLDRTSGIAEYGTGSGITADARAKDEYDELLTKTVAVARPWPRFELLETMRAENGTIVRLDRHLRRMAESADYFGYDFCLDRAEAQLQEAVAGAPMPARVRLLLSADGNVRVEVYDLEELPEARRVSVAKSNVDSRNRFLFHKTTQRALYETQLREAGAVFDVLLYNERGEITEFTRANVVVQIGGQKYTPARSCGLLAGVFREELLEQGFIVERVVRRDELAQADRVWWINSLREWVDVELV